MKTHFVSVLALLVTLCQMWSSSADGLSVVPYPRPPERDVSDMCAVVRCYVPNTVCRVLKACDHPKCRPHVACVPCVPQGADDICNVNNYINTVLVGRSNQNQYLSPLNCNASLPNNETGCPKGSVCAKNPNSEELGACCYGKPDHFPVLDPLNPDPRCDVDTSNLCGVEGCPKGHSCQESRRNGTVSYECKPYFKQGRCPPVPYYSFDLCLKLGMKGECDIDGDCPGDEKCCRAACGGRACLSPY